MLRAVPGIGPWTVAEVAVRAWGDPDAVSVGDFHLKNLVAFALAGEPRGDDARMLELLAPYAGRRALVVRVLELGGPRPPRYGPRLAPRDIRDHLTGVGAGRRVSWPGRAGGAGSTPEPRRSMSRCSSSRPSRKVSVRPVGDVADDAVHARVRVGRVSGAGGRHPQADDVVLHVRRPSRRSARAGGG